MWLIIIFKQKNNNEESSIMTIDGERAFRYHSSGYFNWSFQCSLELLHLRRCFQHKITPSPTHPPPLATWTKKISSARIPLKEKKDDVPSTHEFLLSFTRTRCFMFVRDLSITRSVSTDTLFEFIRNWKSKNSIFIFRYFNIKWNLSLDV